jgi:hypothetical protein
MSRLWLLILSIDLKDNENVTGEVDTMSNAPSNLELHRLDMYSPSACCFFRLL